MVFREIIFKIIKIIVLRKVCIRKRILKIINKIRCVWNVVFVKYLYYRKEVLVWCCLKVFYLRIDRVEVFYVVGD